MKKQQDKRTARGAKKTDRAEIILHLFREFPNNKFSLKQLASASGGASKEGRRETLEILGRLFEEGIVEECAREKYRLTQKHLPHYEGIADMTAGIYMMPPASDSKDLPRFEALVKYHRCACDQTFTFSGTKSRDERDLWLTLSDNLYMRPFEYIIPIQILSARIPSLKGVEGLGHDRFKVLDGLVKTKARHD